MALPLTATAAEVYQEGNISTTYVTYFQDILSKVSPFDDYVFYRSGQNQYAMLVGDLYIADDTIYSFERCKLYEIYTTSSSYTTIYKFRSNYYSEYSVTVGDALVYSNIGDYPDLIERGDNIETVTLLTLLVIVCMYLVSRIFNFTLRSRSRW